MNRTTVLLPDSFKLSAEREAKKEGISFGELVRRAIQRYLLSKKEAVSQDPFLSSQTFFKDKGPKNVSEKHDDTLTEINPHGKF